MISRREVMGGVVTGAALMGAGGARAQASNDPALKALLDQIAKGGPAAERLALLRGFAPVALSPAAQLDHAAVLQSLETEAEIVRRFPFGTGVGSPYVVTTRSGAWLKAAEAVKAGDGSALAKRLDAETAQIAADAAYGVAPPAFVIDKVLAGQSALDLAAAPEVAAALGRQHAALADVRDQAGQGAGVCRFKDGEAYYGLLLRLNLGMAITPRDAHARALDAAKALTARADVLLKGQGLTQGSVGERLTALSRDNRWLYSDDDAGRDQAAADMNLWLDKAIARLPTAFATLAPGARNVRIRRMSPADEAAGRQGYREVPAFDGSKPGAYYVDLKAIRARPSWTLPSVVHHESLPGHMVQIPLEAASGAHPLRVRLACPGFVEGWAAYAEQLADEQGAFAGDPLAQLGYVQWMLFRVGRLLVDTGMHSQGWSQDKAMAVFADLQGPPPVFAPIAQDVERAAIGPAASAGQGLAGLELLRLRAAARAAQGARFDLKAFHDAALVQGSTPLALLRTRVLG
ncbi:MAG: DUF885 domain-containing protein [bacterium]|nr:DUF885 domain-containing protein [bacterium]